MCKAITAQKINLSGNVGYNVNYSLVTELRTIGASAIHCGGYRFGLSATNAKNIKPQNIGLCIELYNQDIMFGYDSPPGFTLEPVPILIQVNWYTSVGIYGKFNLLPNVKWLWLQLSLSGAIRIKTKILSRG